MTREEAIEFLGQYIDNDCYTDKCQDAHRMDLAALRGPTREMVERMRGEWMAPVFADQQDANDPRLQCSECGSIETPLARHRFCASCGAPMTDEAVDIELRRMEEMTNEH